MTAPVDAELAELTPDQLEEGVHNALKAHDVEAVYGFLLLMAVKDPRRAERIRRDLLFASAIADLLDAAEDGDS